MGNEIVKKEKVELISYNLDDKTIAELKTKYMDITIPPGDADAYAMVKAGIKEVNKHINDVTDWHKDGKAPYWAVCKHFDSEKNRVLDKLEPVKEYLKEQKQIEDDRINQIEEDRINAIWAKIEKIKQMGFNLGNMEALELSDRLCEFETLDMSEVEFSEFRSEAILIMDNARKEVKAALEWRMQQDEKEAAQKIEEERLAKQKAEQDRIAAEQKTAQDKIDAENKRIADERAKFEREQREAKEKKEREELEERIRKEEQTKAEQKAKEVAEKAEAERKAKEAKEAREAQEKAEREAKEVARLEALKPEKERCLSYLLLLSEVEQPKVEDKNLIALLKRMTDGINLITKLIQETK